jgi:hypothetical protein
MLSPRVAGLLTEWLGDATGAERAHSQAADHFSALDWWIGGAAAVLAAVIATSVFATLQQPLSTLVRVVAALVTFAAAALSGLQTFMKAAAKAELHRQASRRYAALVRDIEQLQTDPPDTDAKVEQDLDHIRGRFEDAGKEAPNVPPRIQQHAQP